MLCLHQYMILKVPTPDIPKLLTVLTNILEESSRGREVEREDNSWAILKT